MARKTQISSTEQQVQQKRDDLRRKNAANRANRDIGPIPDILNPVERENAKWDLLYHLERYHPEKWYLGWAPDHRKLIHLVQESFLGRSADDLIAVAMPRGSGKTSIARSAVEWAVLHGHLRWPILLEADADAYTKQMRAFQVTFRTKDSLRDDFPETIWVVRQMSTSQSAPNMTCCGENIQLVWKTNEIILPTTYMGLELGTAGGVFSGGGITGSVRGAQVTLATGEVLRPDAFVVNDPQTKESAGSAKQIQDRLEIISGDLLGMGGPGKPMRGVMTMTVIKKDDLAYRVLGPEFPQWRSIRGKWLQQWPTNMELWKEYGSLLRRIKAEEGDINEVNRFYEEHKDSQSGLGWVKAGLEEGAKVYWKARVNPPYLTSLQSFMSWWILDPNAAMAEGNNEPIDPHEPEDIIYCSREEILAKQSALERYECPDDAVELVAMIDMQLELGIYSVMAICPGFRRYVIDYGTWPDQGRHYWTKQQLNRKLSDIWDSPKQSWIEMLRALTGQLKETEFSRTNGQRMHLSFGNIDASWGQQTDVVFQFCRESGEGIWFPSYGVGITAGKNEINHGSEQKAWQKRHRDWGPHWNCKPDHDRGHDRYAYDSYWFMSFVHSGIRTPEQEDGSLQFFNGDHQLLADHLRANWPEKTSGRGRDVTEWKLRPGADDDFFDCVSGCGMGGSAKKIAIPGMEGFGRRLKRRKAKTFGRKNLKDS